MMRIQEHVDAVDDLIERTAGIRASQGKLLTCIGLRLFQ